eukprot:scaffold63_cov306-Pinguiococcus_pyrenoidosus.AAC.2
MSLGVATAPYAIEHPLDVLSKCLRAAVVASQYALKLPIDGPQVHCISQEPCVGSNHAPASEQYIEHRKLGAGAHVAYDCTAAEHDVPRASSAQGIPGQRCARFRQVPEAAHVMAAEQGSDDLRRRRQVLLISDVLIRVRFGFCVALIRAEGRIVRPVLHGGSHEAVGLAERADPLVFGREGRKPRTVDVPLPIAPVAEHGLLRVLAA